MKRGLFFLLFMVAFVFKGFSQSTPADSTEMYNYIDSVLAETRGPIKRTDFFNLMTTFNGYVVLKSAGGDSKLNIVDTTAMLASYTRYVEFLDSVSALRADLGAGALQLSDTAAMLTSYIQRSDTAAMLSYYRKDSDRKFQEFTSASQVLTKSFSSGDVFYVNGNRYLVQSSPVSGYTTDTLGVIPTANNLYAIAQAQNGILNLSVFGAVVDDGNSDRDAMQRAINFADTVLQEPVTILADKQGIYYMDTTDNAITLDYTNGITLDGANNIWYFQPYYGGGSTKVGFNVDYKGDTNKIVNWRFHSTGIYTGSGQLANPGDITEKSDSTSNWLPIDYGADLPFTDNRRSTNIEISNCEFKETYFSYRIRANDVVTVNNNSIDVIAPYRYFGIDKLYANNIDAQTDTNHVKITNTAQHAFYNIDLLNAKFENVDIIGDSLGGSWSVPIRDISSSYKSYTVYNNLRTFAAGRNLFGTEHTRINGYEHFYPRASSTNIAIFDLASQVKLEVNSLTIISDSLTLLNGGKTILFQNGASNGTYVFNDLNTTADFSIAPSGGRDVGLVKINGGTIINPHLYQSGAAYLFDVNNTGAYRQEVSNLSVILNTSGASWRFMDSGDEDTSIFNNITMVTKGFTVPVLVTKRDSSGLVVFNGLDISKATITDEALLLGNADGRNIVYNGVYKSDGKTYYDAGTGRGEVISAAEDENGNAYLTTKSSGWAHYIDTAYATAADSFYVAQGSTLTLPIKANMTAALATNYLPNGVDSLFSQHDSTILGIATGASYTVRVTFKAKNSSNTGYATLALDIGTGGTPNIATAESLVFPKGAGVETQESKTILLYSLDTFVANGCKIKVTADTGNLEIYDIRLLIRLDSRP